MRERKRNTYSKGQGASLVKLGWRTEGANRVAVADYRDSAGRRRRTEIGRNLSLDEARAALDCYYDARLAVEAQQAQHTVGNLWRLWMAYRERDKLRNDIYDANWRSLAPHFEHRAPARLTDVDWRGYAEARFAAGRSPATVQTELARLKACLAWAVANHLLERMPIYWIPSRGEPRKRVLTVDEMQALITAAGSLHVHLFIVLAFATGARHRAILDLTWDRVDFERGEIAFETSEIKDPMSRSWKKGRATVPMGSRVRAELEHARMRAVTDHVIERDGRPITTVKNGFSAAVRRAGLSADITPHTIRHTVATWLAERGISLEERARLLGHADSRTTELVYSHAGSDFVSGAVSALDESLRRLPPRSVRS